jgi:predicted dehydrogenase
MSPLRVAIVGCGNAHHRSFESGGEEKARHA